MKKWIINKWYQKFFIVLGLISLIIYIISFFYGIFSPLPLESKNQVCYNNDVVCYQKENFEKLNQTLNILTPFYDNIGTILSDIITLSGDLNKIQGAYQAEKGT